MSNYPPSDDNRGFEIHIGGGDDFPQNEIQIEGAGCIGHYQIWKIDCAHEDIDGWYVVNTSKTKITPDEFQWTQIKDDEISRTYTEIINNHVLMFSDPSGARAWATKMMEGGE